VPVLFSFCQNHPELPPGPGSKQRSKIHTIFRKLQAAEDFQGNSFSTPQVSQGGCIIPFCRNTVAAE
jgi:hypothetical protein